MDKLVDGPPNNDDPPDALSPNSDTFAVGPPEPNSKPLLVDDDPNIPALPEFC